MAGNTLHTIEEQRIALGLRPRTLHGWIFWWQCWSPYAGFSRRLRATIAELPVMVLYLLVLAVIGAGLYGLVDLVDDIVLRAAGRPEASTVGNLTVTVMLVGYIAWSTHLRVETARHCAELEERR